MEAPQWNEVETASPEPDEPIPDADVSVAVDEGLPAEKAPLTEDVDTLSPRRRLLTPAELAHVAADVDVAEVPIFERPEGPDAPLMPVVDEELRRRIAQQITAEDLAFLDEEISRLYREVEERLSRIPELSARALQKLNEARIILMGDPSRFPIAELRVEEVRVLLKQVEQSEADAGKYAGRFFLYNILMLAIFLGLAILDRMIAMWLVSRGITPPFELPLQTDTGRLIPLTMAMYFAPWYCMIWGGIGGTIGSMYVLRKYVSNRQFDRGYNVHYWAHPIMGAVLGAIVYYLFVGGFFIVGAISQTDVLLDPAQRVLTATSPMLILIALAFGLVQYEAYKMLYRILKAVTGKPANHQQVQTQDQ
ncbi:MAG: hypothetical protein Q9O62_14425 [Ardenticatenia bacterium]|nr:hypothetical protein [Ardenticatenia bacterium]